MPVSSKMPPSSSSWLGQMLGARPARLDAGERRCDVEVGEGSDACGVPGAAVLAAPPSRGPWRPPFSEEPARAGLPALAVRLLPRHLRTMDLQPRTRRIAPKAVTTETSTSAGSRAAAAHACAAQDLACSRVACTFSSIAMPTHLR